MWRYLPQSILCKTYIYIYTIGQNVYTDNNDVNDFYDNSNNDNDNWRSSLKNAVVKLTITYAWNKWKRTIKII